MSTIQENPLLMTLAASVLHPGLRTILIYDAPYHGLAHIEAYIHTLLDSLGQKSITTQLGSSEHDDNLWGYVPLPIGNVPDTEIPIGGEKAARSGMQLRPQLFAQKQDSQHVDLLLIPNLTEVSLAVARAGIMLMGEPVAHLERNEQSEIWQPQQYWLAACPQSDIGMVSAHLVDRFALRLRWHDALFAPDSHAQHVQYLQQHLAEQEQVSELSLAELTQMQELAALIKQARAYHPQASIETVEAVLDYFTTDPSTTDPSTTRVYHRHEITLARYATTLARIAGASTVSAQYVAQAAALMGLNRAEHENEDYHGSNSSEHETPEHEPQDLSTIGPDATEQPASTQTIPSPAERPFRQEQNEQIVAETQQATLAPLIHSVLHSVLPPDNPYLEDSEPILHEEASLRLPPRHSTLNRADHGSIIGVEKGSSLRDIAIVSTILHAAITSKQRQITQQHSAQPANNIQISPEDLYHYRRSPAPEHMLLLLLDYTSVKHCNWSEALLPYLACAYARRASVSIIKVGAQDARHELQAEIVNARSILVPAIGHALDAVAGRTTPLAHGLRLVQQTLQRNLQHGRNTVQQVTLVVISDGRGNIPLQASIDKRMSTLVTREGIGDAMQIAQEISALKHVESFVLDPRPVHYAHLPQLLAESLGASIQPIKPLLEAAEVEVRQ